MFIVFIVALIIDTEKSAAANEAIRKDDELIVTLKELTNIKNSLQKGHKEI